MEGNFEEQSKLPELKLDAKQAQGFLSFFKKLPNDPRAVRFFDRRVSSNLNFFLSCFRYVFCHTLCLLPFNVVILVMSFCLS
ncbi:dna mismatch repair protein msh2 [Quercus suber]|uniref:Dna mismatch repair protein msh2 n=1 Tax=Quercus suber TaxID=58331 RepID=A0AAW0J6C2_QUESU